MRVAYSANPSFVIGPTATTTSHEFVQASIKAKSVKTIDVVDDQCFDCTERGCDFTGSEHISKVEVDSYRVVLER